LNGIARDVERRLTNDEGSVRHSSFGFCRAGDYPMIGTTLQSRYRLDAELGRGGMGVVYRAHDTLLDRAVAVKLLSDSKLGSEGHARLLREAQAAAQLDHPNIVSVYDVGQADGAPFIVMQLVEGESLQARKPQAVAEIIAIARQLCAALEHAHAHGVVHRDLKPENILVAADGSVRLMDFGLARSRGASRLTEEGALVGSVFYLAPEQALGQEVDSRADLYALGVVLYELVTGRLPFTGDDPLTIISQHIHAPAVPPRTFRADLPPALEAVILKLLAKNPADRFASARDVTLALDNLATETPAAVAVSSGSVASLALLEQLARGRLVGRRSELIQLRELWVRARQGHGHLALISGEPGIGKTRLANEVIVYAQLNSAAVLRGGCYEYEATTPYLPVVEALREWLRAQDADSLRAQLGPTAPELAKLAPEIETRLGPLTPNPPLSANEERLRMFDHAARFLQTLAAERGLLLFIDDLHWADQGTLSLLHYLLRRLRHERLLVLAAYRDVELDRAHPLAAALVEWNRERLATRVPLGRLSAEDTGALLATLFGQASVSAEFTATIHRETEGNPFFIEEVVKSLIEQGQIYREDGSWGRNEIADLAIPQSIKEAIGRRLDRLSAACVDALRAASALGKTFAFRDLAAVAGENDEQLLDALDEASATQLIRAASDETFVFTHDKIREVLYGELNPIRRRRLHQRIGQALESLYAPDLESHAPDLAYHFVESNDLAKGLTYSLRAGDKAERVFAHDEALRFYERARECADALNLPEQLAGIYDTIGEVHELRGAHPLAAEYWARGLQLEQAPEKRAVLKSKIGLAYAQLGDERGLEFLHAALDELNPHVQANELATSLSMIGRYHHYRAQLTRAIEFFDRARALAEPADDPLPLSYIYAYLSGAYQHLARFDKSMEWARRNIALGERKDYPLAVATGYEFLAEDCFALGQWQDTLDFAERDRQIGEKIGAQDRVAWSEFCRAFALYGLGELPAAVAAAQSGLAQAEQNGESRLRVLTATILAFVQADLGDEPAANEHAQLAVRQADELRQVLMQCWSRQALAHLYRQREDWTSALEIYTACTRLLTGTEMRASQLYMQAEHAEVCLGNGRLDEADRLAAEHLALARDAGSRHYQALARRVQGQIFAAQARSAEAADAFDEAVATLDELGSRLELARALHYRGQLRQAQGNRDAARADWTRALVVFEACGAQRDAANMRRLLDQPELA
jgi:hypothetical protein